MMNLDSTAFNPTAYTTALMRTSTLPKLLETDTVLRHSVKSLDKELQDLVYSNYAKFISAAETIKEVRSSVNDMETKLHDLDQNVEEMERVSVRVTRELDRHRHLVDQEVATNSMLRKVQFLVMLPQVMSNAAQAEKWMEAANYWAAGDIIFTKYAEFPSFVRTQHDCRLKAEELYVTLSQKICDATPIEASQAEALSVKLSALRLLACTTIDVARLQQAGVFLVPSASTPPVESSPSRFTSDQVMERARVYFHKKIINAFQEQTNDTVAHIKLDFLHRSEDLERHGKKVQRTLEHRRLLHQNKDDVDAQQQKKEEEENEAEVKSSLVDLSLALRKRYISKMAEVITKSFKNFLEQMEVVATVVGGVGDGGDGDNGEVVVLDNNLIDSLSAEPGAHNDDDGTASSAASSSSASPVTMMMKKQPQPHNKRELLQLALSRFLDEVCVGTTKWMQHCLTTFTSCITNAAAVHAATGHAPRISPADVDTTVTSMCETFFEAILDTEKTFCSIASTFFLSSKASAKNNTNAAATGDEDNTSNAKTAFKLRVARKTQQLLIDLEVMLSDKVSSSDKEAAAMVPPTSSSSSSSSSSVSKTTKRKIDMNDDDDDDDQYHHDSSFLVPILCFAAVARTSARLLPRSALAASATWLSTTHSEAHHVATFAESAVDLANCFVRLCGLRSTPLIRHGLFANSRRFGPDATSEPTEPSELFVDLVTTLRRHFFVVQLLLTSTSGNSGVNNNNNNNASNTTTASGSGASTSTTPRGGHSSNINNQPGSTTSAASSSASSVHHHHHHHQQHKGPFTAQYTRRDVVVGLKADMDRMFAARSAPVPVVTTMSMMSGAASASSSSSASASASSADQHPASFYGVIPAPVPLSSLNVAEVLLMYYLTALVEIVRGDQQQLSFPPPPLQNDDDDHDGSSSSSTSSLNIISGFSRAGFQQVQIDMSLVLHFFGELKEQQLLRHEECSVSVVNELACCAFDRTRERAPLPNGTVEQIAGAKWKAMMRR